MAGLSRVSSSHWVPSSSGVRWSLRAVALPALAVVLMASGASPTGPSLAVYDEEANAICETYNAKVNAVSQSVTKGTAPAQIARNLAEELSLLNSENRQLQKIERPKARSAAFGVVYRQQAAQDRDLAVILTAIEDRDKTKMESSLAAERRTADTVNAELTAAGLTSCVATAPKS